MLGPGDLARAHTREECIQLAQVANAADLYLDILTNL